jgi:hypothetical protein
VAFTAVAFALVAPTRRHLARDQDALATSGCAHDLVGAVRGPGRTTT